MLVANLKMTGLASSNGFPKFDLISDLILTKKLVKVNSFQSRNVKIPSFDPTIKDIIVKNNMYLKNLERVAAAIPST